ncbi:hypothetical protein NQZ68_007573, partial [Xyrichtys novacula]
VRCPSQREQHGAREEVSAHLHRVPRVLFVTHDDSSVTSPKTTPQTRSPQSRRESTQLQKQNPDGTLEARRRTMTHSVVLKGGQGPSGPENQFSVFLMLCLLYWISWRSCPG